MPDERERPVSSVSNEVADVRQINDTLTICVDADLERFAVVRDVADEDLFQAYPTILRIEVSEQQRLEERIVVVEIEKIEKPGALEYTSVFKAWRIWP